MPKTQPAFEITYVDVRLSNKQRRLKRIVRAKSQVEAKILFFASLGDQSHQFKILSTDEVLAEPSAYSLAMLKTHFKKAA